jgi:hypothetical protein
VIESFRALPASSAHSFFSASLYARRAACFALHIGIVRVADAARAHHNAAAEEDIKRKRILARKAIGHNSMRTRKRRCGDGVGASAWRLLQLVKAAAWRMAKRGGGAHLRKRASFINNTKRRWRGIWQRKAAHIAAKGGVRVPAVSASTLARSGRRWARRESGEKARLFAAGRKRRRRLGAAHQSDLRRCSTPLPSGEYISVSPLSQHLNIILASRKLALSCSCLAK